MSLLCGTWYQFLFCFVFVSLLAVEESHHRYCCSYYRYPFVVYVIRSLSLCFNCLRLGSIMSARS